MKKLERADYDPQQLKEHEAQLIKLWLRGNAELRKCYPVQTEAEARAAIHAYMQDFHKEPVFKNDKYQVAVRKVQDGLLHLSIKRIDRQPVHDWRDLQAIKNQLVGPENEAVELYPAESRLVDSANQYHLWCFTDPAYRIPFGFVGERLVTEQSLLGSVQRPLEKATQ